MYGVLLLPFHGEPTLVASFRSRGEFLAAMNLEDSEEGWRAALQYERAVYEILSAAEIEGVLREVSASFPDSFEGCAIQIAEWVDSQSVNSILPDEVASE
ncbi:MAG TPA: hypothetical protein VMT64_08550 [Candidatus Binataceae bacterium]|nr:hypothetical protein [Candidatus Binataceae bacterium]